MELEDQGADCALTRTIQSGLGRKHIQNSVSMGKKIGIHPRDIDSSVVLFIINPPLANT